VLRISGHSPYEFVLIDWRPSNCLLGKLTQYFLQAAIRNMADEDEDLFGTPGDNTDYEELYPMKPYTTTCVKDEHNSVELDITFKDNTVDKRTFNRCKNHPDCIFFKGRCTRIIPDSDDYKIQKRKIPNEPSLVTISLFQQLARHLCK
jgi:hypothetical protein